MQQFTYLVGGIFGVLSIVLGAFGSHALKKKWSKDLLEIYETGVKYQMYHALFLLLLANTLNFSILYSKLAVILCITGTLLFSGSIYGICILKNRTLSAKPLGPLTPLGGLCLLLSWLFFIIAIV